MIRRREFIAGLGAATWPLAALAQQSGRMRRIGVLLPSEINKFIVMGFCIGGPFIWNLLKRAPDRIVAAVLAQPVTTTFPG